METLPVTAAPTAPPSAEELGGEVIQWPAVLITSYELKRAEQAKRLAAEFAELEKVYDLAS